MFSKRVVIMTILAAVCLAGCKRARASKVESPADVQSSAATSNTSELVPATLTKPKLLADERLSISWPPEGAQVVHREIVRGMVSDPKAKVWVVVRPMVGSDYWVQPHVDVEKDGTWSVQVYIGESESSNIGQHFKISAVANPKQRLTEGGKLRAWPAAQWQSPIIEVVKK